MTNLYDGVFEATYINEQVKVGNTTKMTTTNIGKLLVIIEQKYGTKKNIILDKVRLVPELWTDLFSIGSLLKNNGIYQTTDLLYHYQRIISSSRLIDSL